MVDMIWWWLERWRVPKLIAGAVVGMFVIGWGAARLDGDRDHSSFYLLIGAGVGAYGVFLLQVRDFMRPRCKIVPSDLEQLIQEMQAATGMAPEECKAVICQERMSISRGVLVWLVILVGGFFSLCGIMLFLMEIFE